MSEEYIKREDAIRSIADHDEFKGERWIKEAWADYLIEDAKPADVAPVRHGRWMKNNNPDYEYVYCSECRTEYDETDIYIGGTDIPRYCPNCGARMDGGNDE